MIRRTGAAKFPYASTVIGTFSTKGGPYTIPLDSSPEHAAALGRLLGHWAVVELQLSGILQLLLRTQQGPARYIWRGILSTRAKIEILQRLNWHYLPDQPLKEELDQHLKVADSLNAMRNAYVHALWSTPTRDSKVLLRHRNSLPRQYKETFRDAEPFTSADIEKDVASLAEFSGRLADWQDRCAKAFRRSPAK